MFNGMLCGMGSSSQLFHPLDCDVYTSMTMFYACLFGKVLLNVYITECIPLHGLEPSVYLHIKKINNVCYSGSLEKFKGLLFLTKIMKKCERLLGGEINIALFIYKVYSHMY